MAGNLEHKIEERPLIHELGAIVACVGEDMNQPRLALADKQQDPLRTGAVRHFDRRELHDQQQPSLRYRDVALACNDPFAAVKAAYLREGSLHRLAVEHAAS